MAHRGGVVGDSSHLQISVRRQNVQLPVRRARLQFHVRILDSQRAPTQLNILRKPGQNPANELLQQPAVGDRGKDYQVLVIHSLTQPPCLFLF